MRTAILKTGNRIYSPLPLQGVLRRPQSRHCEPRGHYWLLSAWCGNLKNSGVGRLETVPQDRFVGSWRRCNRRCDPTITHEALLHSKTINRQVTPLPLAAARPAGTRTFGTTSLDPTSVKMLYGSRQAGMPDGTVREIAALPATRVSSVARTDERRTFLNKPFTVGLWHCKESQYS